MSWLTRDALERVLQSLLRSEIAGIRQRQSVAPPSSIDDDRWSASLSLGVEGDHALGCDSLELLWLASAVNEMFCLYDSLDAQNLLAAKTFGAWIEIVDQGWNTAGQRITFTTSGSSGVPKRCTHRMEDLQRETSFLAEVLHGPQRVIALTPSHHIYGFLFTALLPSYLGVPVAPAEALAPAALMAEVRAGDLVVSIPPRWEWLARSLPRWPAGVTGITSTAPCPEQVKALLIQNGLETLIEIYGSSETAGVGLCSYPAQHYTLMPHWEFVDSRETPVKLRNASGATSTLQDGIETFPDGTFTVTKRLDGAVQVGGVNVFPDQVAQELRKLPGVTDAVVRLTGEAGRERLKAFIVPTSPANEEALRAALDRWTVGRPTPERIRSFTFGSALPRNAMGKLSDWREEPSA